MVTTSGESQINGAEHVTESDSEMTIDILLSHPWNLWKYRDRYDYLLRNYLLNCLKAAVQLRLQRVHIKAEFDKKRSRKSAAVKRAYIISKNEANKIKESSSGLDLEQLWILLENEISCVITPLEERLNRLLSLNLTTILKNDDKPDEDISKVSFEAENDSKVSQQTQNSDFADPDVELKTSPSDENNQEEKPGKIEDRFFSFEEMDVFADKNFESEENECLDYFDSLGEESDDSVLAADMKFSDFFRDPTSKDEEAGELDEINPLDCDSNLNGLNEDEKQMELLLQKVENDSGIDEESDDISEDFEMEKLGIFNGMGDLGTSYAKSELQAAPEQGKYDEIEEIERELVAKKHWSLMGECIASKRPRNSLLDLDIELPRYAQVFHNSERSRMDQEGVAAAEGAEAVDESDLPLELIIKQRIKAAVFDNVERKMPLESQLEAIERLKKSRNNLQQDPIEIDFSKNTMGLGDVYAQRYRDKFMATEKLDKHKETLTEEFSKLMHKLDSLCNYNIVPKGQSEAEKQSSIPSITVEAPINVVNALKPSECAQKQQVIKVTRNAKKRKFNNKLKGLLKAGKVTVEQVKKIKESIRKKSKRWIADYRAVKATGQTALEKINSEKRSNRRLDITQIMQGIKS